MVSKDLVKFFQAIGFNEYWSFFANSKVDVKYYNHNQQAVIILDISKFLPVKVLQELEQKIKKTTYKIRLKLNVLQTEYSFELIKEYFDYIRTYKLRLLDGICNSLSFDTFTYNNDSLVIRVANSVEAKLIDKEIARFTSYFSRYGFNKLKIRVNIDSAIGQIPDRQSERAKEVAKAKIVNVSVPKISNNFYKKSPVRTDWDNVVDTNKISDINQEIKNVVVTGTVFKISKFFTKTKKWFYTLFITDYQKAIPIKVYLVSEKGRLANALAEVKENDTIRVTGRVNKDTYGTFKNEDLKDYILWADDLIITKPLLQLRGDNETNKRVEFHIHTKMSAMDGVSDASEYIKTAARWGHKAIAFSDHLNLQAYPEISATAKKFPNLKVIYGVEMDLVTDFNIVQNANDRKLDDLEYLVFDLETTGLSTNYHEIIEFGYVIVKNQEIIKQDTILIKPEIPVSEHITELTSITNEMLVDKPMLKEMIAEIKDIIGTRVLVAHNATFDIGFLKAAFKKFDLPTLNNSVIDTLQLARVLKPELKYYRLGVVSRAFSVKYDSETAHRADYDALVLAQIFLKMLVKIKTEQNLSQLTNFKELFNENITNKIRGEHITVYAKNQIGLKNLYNIVSQSHTKYFSNSPKIIKAELEKYRDTLLIGSACVNGSVFETAMNKSEAELEEKIKWFDFIEVQPPSVYQQLILRNSLNQEQLHDVIQKIIRVAKQLNKIVIATSDAHYTDPYQKVFRSVIINNKAIGGAIHPLFDYKKQGSGYPDQHLRTTKEMLDEFSFLNDQALINEIVVTNTNKLADQFEKVEAIKSGLYTPEIPDVDNKLRDLVFDRAWKLYGNPLPKVVDDRLTKELNAIITHGFAVVYWIAHKLVAQSLDDGYLVGSRGSVGSSLVATFANITEVNPLQPHYLCLKCHHCEFINDGVTKSGYDLPEKLCPNCHSELTADGHDIPFETFLGFDGDKTPDIDLNFSGEYQLKAHDFTKKMFGEDNVFRAGTISTVASKTAYGFSMNFNEVTKFKARNATLEWLSQGCTGVKRTTGQHPGGIIVVPKKYDILDFTPVNYPADDTTSTWKTTHFDFEAIHDNLLKLDILGHVDPTALRMLHDLTGVDPKTIPNSDAKVLSLFSNLSALGITSEDINGEVTGAIGIPEFGTGFVKKMLAATQPNSFAQLVQISGLSHGTDVWLNNAELLIKNKELGLELKDVIGCRDDIMTYLMYQKLPAKTAFNIMEDVRKGKGLKPEYEKLMQQYHVPQWYIDSCKKIKYMFPKAHATAYVLMAWRVAWYKVYYPHEYYATYFTTRCDIFDIETMLQGKNAIAAKLKDINTRSVKDNSKTTVSAKEKDLVPLLEAALEMYARGISFVNLDIENSETKTFKVIEIENKKYILPAFIVLDGLGEVNAQSIIAARKDHSFSSLKDLQTRTSITRTNSLLLKELGVLNHLPDENVTEQENNLPSVTQTSALQ